MTYYSVYGYKIEFGSLEHDAYVLNEKNQIVAAFMPTEFLAIKKKIQEKIEKDYGEN